MDLCDRTLTDLADRIRQRDIFPVDLVTAYLDRIDALDGQLRSYLTVGPEQAIAHARRAEDEIAKGLYRSPLQGSNFAVKGVIATRGVRTTLGMSMHRDAVPEHDATVVARLKQAGCILLGKLHTTEGATVHHDPAMPPPVNPWSP